MRSFKIVCSCGKSSTFDAFVFSLLMYMLRIHFLQLISPYADCVCAMLRTYIVTLTLIDIVYSIYMTYIEHTCLFIIDIVYTMYVYDSILNIRVYNIGSLAMRQ